jgi:hypothetical protein
MNVKLQKIHDLEEDPQIKLLADMQPCEFGIVVNPKSSFDGELVMRTSSTENFQVMNLSNICEDNYWKRDGVLKVRPLKSYEEFHLILKGDK